MSKGSHEGATEHARLLLREATMAKLRQRYARFGDEVVQFLYDHSSQPGGLRRVLSKVLHPLPLDEERMHEALVRFLSTEGPATFLAWVAPKESGETGPITGAEVAANEKGRPQTTAPERSASDGKVGMSRGEVSTGLGTALRDAEGTWDGVERRSGHERRTGLERRSGRDRRNEVEMVFKNRRFGSDRRTGIERRSGRDRRQNPPPPNIL